MSAGVAAVEALGSQALVLLHSVSHASCSTSLLSDTHRRCAILQVPRTRRWLRKLGLPVKLQWRPSNSGLAQVFLTLAETS